MSLNVGIVVHKRCGLPNNRSGIMKKRKVIFGLLPSVVDLVAKSASQGAARAQFDNSFQVTMGEWVLLFSTAGVYVASSGCYALSPLRLNSTVMLAAVTLKLNCRRMATN